jgi:hypothetical protein
MFVKECFKLRQTSFRQVSVASFSRFITRISKNQRQFFELPNQHLQFPPTLSNSPKTPLQTALQTSTIFTFVSTSSPQPTNGQIHICIHRRPEIAPANEERVENGFSYSLTLAQKSDTRDAVRAQQTNFGQTGFSHGDPKLPETELIDDCLPVSSTLSGTKTIFPPQQIVDCITWT